MKYKILTDAEYKEMVSGYLNLTEEEKTLLRYNDIKRKRESDTSEDIAKRVDVALANFFTEMKKPGFPLGYDEIAEMHTLTLRFEERDTTWLSLYAKEIIVKCKYLLYQAGNQQLSQMWIKPWHQLLLSLNSVMLYVRKVEFENG